MSNKGIVTIHGREYKTVARRVAEFHRAKTELQRITTELVYHDETRVVMKATVWDSDVEIGTGYGEEWRESSKINKTSAMENAETSAIGRALACIGLGGDEYASADEVLRAIDQQEKLDDSEPIVKQEEEIVTEEDDEPWGDDPPNIPDDILDVVKENYKIIHSRWGNADTWHKQILSNFMGVKGDGTAKKQIGTLDKAQLWKLSQLQNDHIKLNRGDE